MHVLARARNPVWGRQGTNRACLVWRATRATTLAVAPPDRLAAAPLLAATQGASGDNDNDDDKDDSTTQGCAPPEIIAVPPLAPPAPSGFRLVAAYQVCADPAPVGLAHLPWRHRTRIRMQGTVTGVVGHARGLVTLDSTVTLCLAQHPLPSLGRGIRVGATLTVRHAHVFRGPSGPVLAACARSCGLG